jgi:hypothetical protein
MTRGDDRHGRVPLPFSTSLCHSCVASRYVKTATSTFILCSTLPNKYPPQPVQQCVAFREREKSSEGGE